MLRVTILLLATLLVAAPVVHTHPLAGGEGVGIASPGVCAMCAVAAQQITVVRASLTAPAVVADLLVAITPVHHSLNAARPLPARAPPAS